MHPRPRGWVCNLRADDRTTFKQPSWAGASSENLILKAIDAYLFALKYRTPETFPLVMLRQKTT